MVSRGFSSASTRARAEESKARRLASSDGEETAAMPWVRMAERREGTEERSLGWWMIDGSIGLGSADAETEDMDLLVRWPALRARVGDWTETGIVEVAMWCVTDHCMFFG